MWGTFGIFGGDPVGFTRHSSARTNAETVPENPIAEAALTVQVSAYTLCDLVKLR